MLADADVVKILLGEKVTEEIRSKQKQSGMKLLDLVKEVKTPKYFQEMSPQEQEAFIEAKLK
jgi:hypothetical protein